jgi:hypothetical protein
MDDSASLKWTRFLWIARRKFLDACCKVFMPTAP